MSELQALRNRTADRLVEAGVATYATKALWLPSTDDQLPVLIVTARQTRKEAESRGANVGHPAFIERGTIIVVYRAKDDDGEVLEDLLLTTEQQIMEALLNDADWLAEIEAVETITSTIQSHEAKDSELTFADLVIEITARWRMDFGPGGAPLSSIRGEVPWDGNPAFGADDLDD